MSSETSIRHVSLEMERRSLSGEKQTVSSDDCKRYYIGISFLTVAIIVVVVVTSVLFLTLREYKDDQSEIFDDILQSGVDQYVYPGVAAIIGNTNDILYENYIGRYSYDLIDTKISRSTLFDLASLTKVIATTSAVALLYQEGYLYLSTKVASILGDDFANNGKEDIEISHCLLHNAGFAPDPDPRYWSSDFGCPNTDDPFPAQDFSCVDSIYASLMQEELVTTPGDTYAYSDLSFITLQMVVGTMTLQQNITIYEDIASCLAEGNLTSAVNSSSGVYYPLARICAFDHYVSAIFALRDSDDAAWMPDTQFRVQENRWNRCAPTNNDTGADSYTKKRIQGQVADGNAYAMGGIAGHAGLFSTARDLANFARHLLQMKLGRRSNAVVEGFLNVTTVKLFSTLVDETQSSRALGWSTNSDVVADFGFNNSCGTMTKETFMHIGYTGTCICIDATNQLYSIILSNRAYNCEGQSCPPEISYRVKSIYRQFNTQAREIFRYDVLI